MREKRLYREKNTVPVEITKQCSPRVSSGKQLTKSENMEVPRNRLFYDPESTDLRSYNALVIDLQEPPRPEVDSLISRISQSIIAASSGSNLPDQVVKAALSLKYIEIARHNSVQFVGANLTLPRFPITSQVMTIEVSGITIKENKIVALTFKLDDIGEAFVAQYLDGLPGSGTGQEITLNSNILELGPKGDAKTISQGLLNLNLTMKIGFTPQDLRILKFVSISDRPFDIDEAATIRIYSIAAHTVYMLARDKISFDSEISHLYHTKCECNDCFDHHTGRERTSEEKLQILSLRFNLSLKSKESSLYMSKTSSLLPDIKPKINKARKSQTGMYIQRDPRYSNGYLQIPLDTLDGRLLPDDNVPSYYPRSIRGPQKKQYGTSLMEGDYANMMSFSKIPDRQEELRHRQNQLYPSLDSSLKLSELPALDDDFGNVIGSFPGTIRDNLDFSVGPRRYTQNNPGNGENVLLNNSGIGTVMDTQDPRMLRINPNIGNNVERLQQIRRETGRPDQSRIVQDNQTKSQGLSSNQQALVTRQLPETSSNLQRVSTTRQLQEPPANARYQEAGVSKLVKRVAELAIEDNEDDAAEQPSRSSDNRPDMETEAYIQLCNNQNAQRETVSVPPEEDFQNINRSTEHNSTFRSAISYRTEEDAQDDRTQYRTARDESDLESDERIGRAVRITQYSMGPQNTRSVNFERQSRDVVLARSANESVDNMPESGAVNTDRGQVVGKSYHDPRKGETLSFTYNPSDDRIRVVEPPAGRSITRAATSSGNVILSTHKGVTISECNPQDVQSCDGDHPVGSGQQRRSEEIVDTGRGVAFTDAPIPDSSMRQLAPGMSHLQPVRTRGEQQQRYQEIMSSPALNEHVLYDESDAGTNLNSVPQSTQVGALNGLDQVSALGSTQSSTHISTLHEDSLTQNGSDSINDTQSQTLVNSRQYSDSGRLGNRRSVSADRASRNTVASNRTRYYYL